MIAPHAIQRHPSNAQPRLRVLHSGCRRACWAMMMRQARRSSAIQHYTVRCGFLSQRSYVAPSRQRRSSSKRPRKELTYCPIYGFKSFLICAKDLTPALFCGPSTLGRHRYRSCQPQPTASKPAPAKEMASRTLAWPPEKTENREASVGAKTPTSQGWRSQGQARKPRQHWGNGQKKSQPMRVGILGIGGAGGN